MKSMNGTQHGYTIKKALARHIASLLPGATLSGPYHGGISPSFIVCYDTWHKLQVHLSPDCKQYFTFERVHPFSEQERSFLEEILRGLYAKALAGEKSLDAAMAESVTHAVSRHVAPEFAETVTRVIKAYEEWGSRGRDRTTHTTGIRQMRRKNPQSNYFGSEEAELVKALGSSPDTLVVIDTRGGIRNVEKVPHVSWESKGGQEIFAPVAHMGIAAWANSRRKVAVRLEEDKSILLFSLGGLLFAKQGGGWCCPPHTLAEFGSLPESIDGIEPETVKAVYLTALDLTEGDSDMHINLVRNPEERLSAKLRKGIIRLASGKSSKNAKLLSSMIHAGKFQEIPRPVRAEVCSWGGTLLLDGQGRILGVDLSGNTAVAPITGGDGRGHAVPGNAYIELLNRVGKCKLQLTIF